MEFSFVATVLATGLAWSLSATRAEQVNPGYFRSSLLVILGLLVVALASGWSQLSTAMSSALIAAAVASYLGFVLWSLERARLAAWAGAALSLIALLSLAIQAHATTADPSLVFANSASSALLLGSSLGAMLLGHYYLTAPWMSLSPLRRMVVAIALASLLRAGISAIGLRELWSQPAAAPIGAIALSRAEWTVFLGLRWGVGLAAPLVLAAMVWRTLAHNATQAATGILYVVMIVTLIGETTATALARTLGGTP